MRAARVGLWAMTVIGLVAPPAAGQVTSITGTVYDSVSRRHLSGAVVQLARLDRPSEGRTTRSQADGVFRFDSVGVGSWLLGFFHPSVDSLGIEAPMLRIVIGDSTPVRAMLAIPSPRTILTSSCGADSAARGMWVGRVRDARTSQPIDSASVVAQWSVITASGNTISRQTPGITVVTDASGAFGICGLPTDEMVVMRSWKGADSTGTSMIALPAHGILVRDLFIAPAQNAQRRVADPSSRSRNSIVVPVLTGGARLQGRVVRANGRPVGGARVRLADAGVEATTNQEGYYALDSLPLGTRLVDARAIGFLPVTRVIDLLPSAPVAMDVVLESRQVFLDTVKVVADRVYESPQYRDFLQRKRRGWGYFADENDLNRMDPAFLSDVVRRFPGVMVSGANRDIFFRSTGSQGYCRPTVWIDGMMTLPMEGFSTDYFLPVEQVRGIEVYTRTGGMPAQYQTMNGCGALVVWTGARRLSLPPP